MVIYLFAVKPAFASLQPNNETSTWQLTIPAMGTFWHLEGETNNKINFPTSLQEDVIILLYRIEKTFSDWDRTSELRKLEKKNLTQWTQASSLFITGLSLAKELFIKTDKIFDITIGQTLWHKKSAIGSDHLEINLSNLSFRFKVHPRRLTFDGFIKGYTVGLIAQKLFQAGFIRFSINAGGGDQAEFIEQKITFKSFSGSSYHSIPNQLHIYSPSANYKNPSLKKFAAISCQSFASLNSKWPEIGATTDAFATASVISNLKLPTNCQVINSSRLD